MNLRRGAVRQAPVPERTTAWLVGEGDELASGATVLQVQRDAVAQTVRVCTTHHPRGMDLGANDPVWVIARAL